MKQEHICLDVAAALSDEQPDASPPMTSDEQRLAEKLMRNLSRETVYLTN